MPDRPRVSIGIPVYNGEAFLAETLDSLLASDPGRANRQVGIVDARGGSASFTGERCSEWAGDTTAPGLAAQGNILAGPEVVRAMAEAFTRT